MSYLSDQLDSTLTTLSKLREDKAVQDARLSDLDTRITDLKKERDKCKLECTNLEGEIVRFQHILDKTSSLISRLESPINLNVLGKAITENLVANRLVDAAKDFLSLSSSNAKKTSIPLKDYDLVYRMVIPKPLRYKVWGYKVNGVVHEFTVQGRTQLLQLMMSAYIDKYDIRSAEKLYELFACESEKIAASGNRIYYWMLYNEDTKEVIKTTSDRIGIENTKYVIFSDGHISLRTGQVYWQNFMDRVFGVFGDEDIFGDSELLLEEVI